MHQPCECRTVYHCWKHCGFHFSTLRCSPVVVNQFQSVLIVHHIYDWELFAYIKLKYLSFLCNLWCYYLPICSVNKTYLCCYFLVYPEAADLILFTDINCLARIDFSNSNLCCGFVPKPTQCLTSTVLIPTIVDLLRCVMASFVF